MGCNDIKSLIFCIIQCKLILNCDLQLNLLAIRVSYSTLIYSLVDSQTHARIQKTLAEGSNSTLTTLFLVDEGRGERNQISLKADIIGPPAKRHLNGIWLADRSWSNIKCWLGSVVIFQGIPTSISKEPYSFMILQGEVVRTLCPSSGSTHETAWYLVLRLLNNSHAQITWIFNLHKLKRCDNCLAQNSYAICFGHTFNAYI